MTYNVNFYLEYHNIVFSFSHLREPCFSFASNMTESLNFTNESDRSPTHFPDIICLVLVIIFKQVIDIRWPPEALGLVLKLEFSPQ